MHVEWTIVTGNPQVTRKLKEFAKLCCACNISPKLAFRTSVMTIGQSRYLCILCQLVVCFLVQVHNRSEYLYQLVNSLRSVRDIEQALLIFSHDVYSSELNSIVASIDFCPVSWMTFSSAH